ncbi:MAG: glycosyltransferase family 4 protein [Nitrospirae bacterium]|nr:glycosyltransferase family 4 protein [Nitrospirota bacterium]
MKNILILDTGKEWGGGTNSLLELLRRIDKKNYKFTALFYHNYIKPGEADIKTEIEKLGINFLLLKYRRQSLSAKILKETGRTLLFFSEGLRKLYVFSIEYFFRIEEDAARIARILKEFNIDLLYMNNQPSSNLEGIIAARMAGIKSLLHGRIETELNFFEVKAVNKWLDKMICVSEGVRESFLKQGIEPSKCITVYNGIDAGIIPTVPPDRIRQELGIKGDELLIGSAGSLVKRKRFADLIKAMADIRNQSTTHGESEAKMESLENPPLPPFDKGGMGGFSNKIKCVILGDGPEREQLQKEIEKNKLNDYVMLINFKSDAISYMAAMDLFILPSEREGFPRVILEAMLMGKPVIASRIAGPLELVVDGRTGFLYNTGDTKALSGYITELVSEPSLRKFLGGAGRKRVIENFSIEKYAGEVENIITEVLEQ